MFVLRDFALACQSLLQSIQTNENSARNQGNWRYAQKDLRDVIRRADINLHEIDYVHLKIPTQFSVIYNQIVQRDSQLNYEIAKASKRDSSAMKTISTLTLPFLPVTFVSAGFSTTVFDFQNSDAVGQAAISKGGWIYLLCCILSTIATFGTWYPWTRHSERNKPKEMGWVVCYICIGVIICHEMMNELSILEEAPMHNWKSLATHVNRYLQSILSQFACHNHFGLQTAYVTCKSAQNQL